MQVVEQNDRGAVTYLLVIGGMPVAECTSKVWADAIAEACTIVAGIGKASLEQKCPVG